jgi:hypothetical protein
MKTMKAVLLPGTAGFPHERGRNARPPPLFGLSEPQKIHQHEK